MDYFSSLYQKAMREAAKGLEKNLINRMQEIKTTLEEQKMNKVKVNKNVAMLLSRVKGGGTIAFAEGNVGRLVFWFLEMVNESGAGGLSTQGWLDANGISVADIENAFKYGWEEEYEFKDRDLVVPRYGGNVFEVFTTNKEGIWCAEKINLFSQKTLFQKGEIDLVCQRENREDLKL